MNKESEVLLLEMRDIFGDSFGGNHYDPEPVTSDERPGSDASAFVESVMTARNKLSRGYLAEKTGGDTKGAGHGKVKKRGGRTHHPFKRSAELGPGPRGSKHKESQCWRCTCGNIYSDGCRCVGTGASSECPKGRVKTIKIDKKYRDGYNSEYHPWRAKNSGEIARRLGSVRGAHDSQK